jgi:hypothetical protein
VSSYVENVDLISPRQPYNCKEHEGKNDKTDRPIIIIIIIIIIIQFFIYLRADSTAIAFYRVSTDIYNRNSGQHKDSVQKQHTKTSGLCRQVPNVYIKFN